MTNWTIQERQLRVLRMWAVRATDMINGVPEPRYPQLGNATVYARGHMGHYCRCGHCQVRWDTVLADVMYKLRINGQLTQGGQS